MRTNRLKLTQLNMENFEKYGSFVKLSDVSQEKFFRLGSSSIQFFPDLATLNLEDKILGISVCRVHPREFEISPVEHHDYTEEGMIPLDGDVLMHVGDATQNEITSNEIEIFEVPKLTFVRLKRGVWHYAVFPKNDKPVNCLILLAERTYHNDCEVNEVLETSIPIKRQ